ncbi:FERM domain-containing protein 4B-like isoform X2 [Rhincodon typus]|uniref:FERM domain-containing protein 4B-like isoform X2 n=1 Tax=Rhincodon typus TaxID=259920 RepID=UPI00202F122A|nr:FERM domain-containing protein 4B-like isoform X2 [Rhincodon typus]XP_048475848.1 FERM domain-containing protein 4B-like isoform X2 [Rhincodon typus]
MEVKGSLMTMATGNVGMTSCQRYTKAVKLKTERMRELAERQQAIEETLRRKMVELRELCLREAELTGMLPSDYPLAPGEVAPLVVRRVGFMKRLPTPTINLEEDTQLIDLEHRFANANQGLSVRTEFPEGEPARRSHGYHRWALTDNTKNETQRAMIYPHDFTTTPCGDRTTVPCARDAGRSGQALGWSQGWTLLPPDVYCQAKGRRRSYANPARLLQRSMSGMERSVPSSPIIYRDRSGQYRYLSSVPRFPDAASSRVEVSSDAGSERPALRHSSQRSSSSETLSDGAAFARPSRRSLGGASVSGRQSGRPGPQPACGHDPERQPVLGSKAGGSAHRRGSGKPVDRDIHRALALEGLRAWYMRAAVYGNQQEHATPVWDRPGLRGTGAVRPSYSLMTPQANWEACRRSTRTSQQVGVTTRGRWYDPPC